MEWQTVVNSIVGSGPLAIVLGAGCVALWRAYQASNEGRIKDLQDIARGAQKTEKQ